MGASSIIQYHPERMNMKTFLKQYLEDNCGEGDKHRIDISFECKSDVCMVCIDGKEFKRILDNLFTNTIRYR